jgi:hypothetical protein
LIVVHADALDTHQIRGNTRKSLAEGELAADFVLRPQIHDLQKRTLIRSAFGHRLDLRVQTDDLLRDRIAVELE